MLRSIFGLKRGSNRRVSDHCGRVVNTPDLYLGCPGFKSWPVDWLS
jgi:hypothetical protein